MKRLYAAVAFLTRVPLPSHWQFDAADVGRATLVYPLVGVGLGLVYLVVLSLLRLHFPSAGSPALGALWMPSSVAAVLLVALNAWLTRALHLDGLADMADGFGGGRSREDVLRIMRGSVIGAYGAVALMLLLAVKITTLDALIARDTAGAYLVIAPALGRWSVVPLGKFLPYARPEEGGLGAAVTDHVGWTELLGATAIAAACALLAAGWRGAICCLIAVGMTAINASMCSRRIGGVTGDTMGANIEVCEAAVLIAAVVLT